MSRYIHQLDLRLFLALLALPRYPLISRIARAVSKTGDGWLYPFLMPASIILLEPEMKGRLMALALAGFILERCAYVLLKNLLRRPRPPEAIRGYASQITASDRFSLPSGHTSAAFFVATFLSFSVSLIFLPLYIWAFSVGLSRIALGVHFPSDILAGACLGSCIAVVIL